jgi:capsular exopolysaccharide synthesis family protein
MEQLRKAILQAKATREGAEITQVIPVAPGPVRPEPEKSAAHLSFDYISTRVVQLDPAHLERMRVLSGREAPEITQAYKVLRTQILQKLKLQNWNAFAVVSPTEGNGKTLTAVNLALSLAQEVKQSVLLVDFDLRAPSVHRHFGISLNKGIVDYLLRDEPIQNILINPGVERLVLLGGNEILEHSSEALGSPRLIQLVEELKQRYPDRIVIFDLPPMLKSDDAIAFAPYVDAMLMVVEEGRTTPEQLERCAELLNGKPILGSVLNKGEV